MLFVHMGPGIQAESTGSSGGYKTNVRMRRVEAGGEGVKPRRESTRQGRQTK